MAIYNNGFPATYQQMYPQYQQPYQQQMPQIPQIQAQQQAQSGIIWVSGEAGARGYIVAPNTTLQLWDSDQKVIYLKSADASGMPSMKILDYTIRDQSTQNGPTNVLEQGKGNNSNYVTKAEYDEVVREIGALKAQVESMSARRATRAAKREESDDEQ